MSTEITQPRLLKGKTALITGASRGIGRSVALALAREGAHVVAVARTTGALEELDDEILGFGGTATLVPLDMRDGDGIDRLGGALYDRFQKLDMLVGNAGILGPLTPVGHITPKQWDEIIAVNVTGNWRLLRAMDPLLRLSSAGRAVFVTSGAAHGYRPFWGAYGTSKAALEALIRTYASETLETTIRVNLFNPGATRTRMRAQAMPGEDTDQQNDPNEVATSLIKLLKPECTETGKIFDFNQQAYLTAALPTI